MFADRAGAYMSAPRLQHDLAQDILESFEALVQSAGIFSRGVTEHVCKANW
jgi:hypothetical protein